MSDTFSKWLWFVAYWHNYIGGLLFVIFGSWVYRSDGLDPPVPGVHYQTWIGLIFVMGLLYHMISWDRFGSRDMVIVATIAKFVSAGPMAWAFLTDNPDVPILIAVPLATDMAFGILFAVFFFDATRKGKWTRRVTPTWFPR